MLSKETVAEHLVPRYQRIAKRFQDAFLCSCGVSTHNLENFAGIKGVRYIRNGWGTDFKKTAQVLRDHHVKAGLDVVRAATLTPDELEKDVLYLLDTLEPVETTSLILINASESVPDENIRRIVHTIRNFAQHNNIEMSDEGTCRLNQVL